MTPDSRKNMVMLNVSQERREGCKRAEQGMGWEILYDQNVKHGFIYVREIKVSQKNSAPLVPQIVFDWNPNIFVS